MRSAVQVVAFRHFRWRFLLACLLAAVLQTPPFAEAITSSPHQRQGAGGAGVRCPRVGTTDKDVHIETPYYSNMKELSGLSLSQSQTTADGHPIFFAVSDSGAGPVLGMWNGKTGQLLRQLKVVGVENQDWEDMALGSCGNLPATATGNGASSSRTTGKRKNKHKKDQQCLYIGDIGDNNARTSDGRLTSRANGVYRIYKMLEPQLGDLSTSGIYGNQTQIELPVLQTLYFDYSHPSSPTAHADSEAIFLDHTGWGEDEEVGDIYVMTKWNAGTTGTADRLNRIFRIPVTVWGSYDIEETPYPVEAIGSYSGVKSNKGIMGRTWNRADMSADGTLISLGASLQSHFFLRCPGATIAQVLAPPLDSTDSDKEMQKCHTYQNHIEGKVESCGFRADGNAFLQFAEGDSPPMEWTELLYDGIQEDDSDEVWECPIPRYYDGTCKSHLDAEAPLPSTWSSTMWSSTMWSSTMWSSTRWLSTR